MNWSHCRLASCILWYHVAVSTTLLGTDDCQQFSHIWTDLSMCTYINAQLGVIGATTQMCHQLSWHLCCPLISSVNKPKWLWLSEGLITSLQNYAAVMQISTVCEPLLHVCFGLHLLLQLQSRPHTYALQKSQPWDSVQALCVCLKPVCIRLASSKSTHTVAAD
jgi:hypothetical protein